MPEEERTDDRDDDEFLDQLVGQIVDRAVDQLRAVIGGDYLYAGRQAPLELGQLRFDRRDGAAGVGALPQHDHAARYLALAIELRDAAPHFRADLDCRDVAQGHWHAACGSAERDRAKLVDGPEITGSADHIFGLAHFEYRSARFLVGVLDRLDRLAMGDTEGGQLHRIEHDLILLHHAADAGDLGHTGHTFQLVTQEPVLQAAQLRQIVAAGPVDQRIFIDPADPGRVGPDRTARRFRQTALHLVQIFEHARARPVKIGAVLEDHIDEAVAEEGVAAHRLGAGHRQHGGGERIGHLVLDDLRRLAGIAGADDDLRIRKVRKRIDRRRSQR